ncbi:hypothetical protein [Sphingomonas sp. 8AM]|uniref:hypothetical protein n=1 Tax=Sphingomonas sp. 8AM TaxID=2653170 RepID=UPI001358D72C|nr:hypothetical protein [Sphingomonas sp. 8AM]
MQTVTAAEVQTGSAAPDESCALCDAGATPDALLLPLSPTWRLPTAIEIVVPVVARAFQAPRTRALRIATN